MSPEQNRRVTLAAMILIVVAFAVALTAYFPHETPYPYNAESSIGDGSSIGRNATVLRGD